MGVWRHSDHTIHAVSDPCHLRNTLLVGCLCFDVTIPYSGFASCGTADDEYIALSEFASIEDGQCKSCALSLTLVLLLQIITVEEAKRRKSVCSYYGEEDDDDALPVLKHHSALLENMHIEQVWLEKKKSGFLIRSAKCGAFCYLWCNRLNASLFIPVCCPACPALACKSAGLPMAARVQHSGARD